jgi:hypothetical protein
MKDNIKMDVTGIEWNDMADLASDRDQWRTVVNAVMTLRIS